ncbi:MAG: nucleotidyltransferase domain-containing protein [Myxococcales bacterium]|nr:nucleotidyltransferase domain-containing protein [Myxococcales bacterium]
MPIVASLQLAFDPTPASVEDLAEHLPASARTAIAWFPPALRVAFIDPLRTAPRGRFREVLEQTAIPAVQLLLRFLANLGGVSQALIDQSFHNVYHDHERERVRHEHIARRLEPVDIDASDALRAAYEWLRVVLTATTFGLPDELVHDHDAADVNQVNEHEMRRNLSGEAGTFLRGMLLTIGAVDLVLEDQPIPANISEWCHQALVEMQSSASSLRARGVMLPSDVTIPGFTAEEWRARRRTRDAAAHAGSRLFRLLPRGGLCPPDILRRIVEELHPQEIWLFGSRARGTARDDSDWDLLVVLPDAESPPPDRHEVFHRLQDLARKRVDITVMRRRDFEANRHALGSLPQIVTSEGYMVHGR